MASSPQSRPERLRDAIKSDLDKRPDLPKKPELTPEPEIKPELEPGPKSHVNATPQPALPNDDSEDSEAGCEIEFTRVYDDEKITELSDSSSEDEGPIFIPTIGNDMKVGQATLPGQAFVTVLVASKFPYRYIPKAESERVADKFFNAGKFFMREWDLFYIWPVDYSDKPLVLISEDQFAQLIKEINTQFPRLYLNVRDSYYRDIGLIIDSMFTYPRYRPRYLGRSKSRDQFDSLVNKAPDSTFTIEGEPKREHRLSDRSLKAFKEMIETSMALNKNKNKSYKDVRREQRVEKQKDMGKQLKRAQQYLGVRPRKEKSPDSQQSASTTEAVIPLIEYGSPVPYPFESSPVFVCIDVEAYERSNKIITEIGVATLDTRDLVDVAPGEHGQNWQQKIRARHFRINEHKHYRNGEFVADNADHFEFGSSEFISLKDAPSIISNCFKYPFSKTEESTENDSAPSAEESVSEKRNIIFVAHNAASDINFLQQVGYNPLNLSNIIETLDTSLLYRAHKRDPNTKALGGILYDFDLVGWNLHNAGNDAVYTLWALMATCIHEASGRGKETEDEPKLNLEAQLAARVEEVKEMVLADHAGWEKSVNEEDDDSGVPVI